MPAELPWSELVRRRNGLPARSEASAEQQFARLRRRFMADTAAAEPRPRLSEPDIDGPFSSCPIELRILRREPADRCPHTDLPTTMCHHCKET